MKKTASSAPKNSPSPEPGDTTRTVLLAVTGKSPAILTETAWALAHGLGVPRCIPHEVIVITTAEGKTAFERELLTGKTEFGGERCWDALRKTLTRKFPEAADRLVLDEVKVIAVPNAATGGKRPLEDIRTRAHNDAAANFILKEVRAIVDNDDCRLIASIAGGRKTMVALLYACMSLRGRSQDLLTHVFINDPFEEPGLTPRFYFPTAKPVMHEVRDKAGNVLDRASSAKARIELCTVPFVPLSKLFVKELGRHVGDFTALVNQYTDQIEQLAERPCVRIDVSRSAIVVNRDTVVAVNTRELGVFAFLLERCRNKQSPYARVVAAMDDLKAFVAKWRETLPSDTRMRNEADEWLKGGGIFDGEINRKVGGLRNSFVRAGLKPALGFLLPRKGSFGIDVRFDDSAPD